MKRLITFGMALSVAILALNLFGQSTRVSGQSDLYRCHGRINASRAAGTSGTPISAPQIRQQWGNQHFCETRSGGSNVVGFGAMWAQTGGSVGTDVTVRLPIGPEWVLGRVVVQATPITAGTSISAEASQTNTGRMITFRLSRPSDFYYTIIHQ